MKLDDNYYLEYDENNVILMYHENKIREKKNKTKEPYVYKEARYYPTVKSALKSYVNQKLKNSEAIQDILDRIDYVELLINKLKTN